VLESLPNIREAVAFPLKSRIHGEIPAAAIVLSERAEDEDISDILRYCQQLLGVRAPRQIRVVRSIPRNASDRSGRNWLLRDGARSGEEGWAPLRGTSDRACLLMALSGRGAPLNPCLLLT
jgi:acyl-coenzyme A synthetase/AMP-(fatty) acid ligase